MKILEIFLKNLDFSVDNQEIDSIYVSLHQIRKQVLTDLNNDNFKEIVLVFSWL